jgi:hypothetical protein
MVPPPANFCSKDAFVAKLNAAGNALIFSTFLGGNNDESGMSIAVDSSGNAYVVGGTYSPDFPTSNAYQPDCTPNFAGSGCADVFISKLSGLQLPVFTGLPRFIALHPPVGTTGTQTVTISNRGDAALSFSNIAMTGIGFSQTNTCLPSPGSLDPGASCTVSVTFEPTDTSFQAGTLTISDNAYLSPHEAQLAGSGSDYVMGAVPSQATIAAGQSASFTVEAQPVNGFDRAIALSCQGVPRGATCRLASSTLQMDGFNIVTTNVTVTTTARSVASAQRWHLRFALAGSLALMAGLLLPGSRGSRGRRSRSLLGIAGVLLLTVGWSVGCGSSSGGSPPNQGTPPGTYTITVSGTSSGLTHNTPFSLTVN